MNKFNTRFFTHKALESFEKTSKLYVPETTEFIFGYHLLRKDDTIKFAHNIVSIDEGLVDWDLNITFYNRLKTFILVEAKLFKYYIQRKSRKSLKQLNILKRSLSFFFTYHCFLYHTLQQFRTYKMNINRVERSSSFAGFITHVRPKNKKLFFNLFLKMNPFFVKNPKFVITERYNKTMFSFSVLGFRIKFKTLGKVHLSFFRRFFNFAYRAFRNIYRKSFVFGDYVTHWMLRRLKRRSKVSISPLRTLKAFYQDSKLKFIDYSNKMTSYMKSKVFEKVFSIDNSESKYWKFFALRRWLVTVFFMLTKAKEFKANRTRLNLTKFRINSTRFNINLTSRVSKKNRTSKESLRRIFKQKKTWKNSIMIY